MSVTCETGEKCDVARWTKSSLDEIERSRDITIVKLRTSGQSWRKIGTFLGLTHKGVMYRWDRIPEEAKSYYGRIGSMGALAGPYGEDAE